MLNVGLIGSFAKRDPNHKKTALESWVIFEMEHTKLQMQPSQRKEQYLWLQLVTEQSAIREWDMTSKPEQNFNWRQEIIQSIHMKITEYMGY
jgi:hypothetical protein